MSITIGYTETSQEGLDSLDELNDSVTVCLVKLTELLNRSASIRLRATMPHDGLKRISGTAVVQTIFCTGAELGQTTTPQRSGTAPTGTDVVLHAKLVLYKIGIRPNLLIRETRHITILEVVSRVLEFVFTRCP